MSSRHHHSWLWRATAALSAVVGLSALSLTFAPVVSAKEYNIAGTVECGRRSGQRCDIGNTLQLWTWDVNGRRQLVTIDVSWIRRKLPNLDQDEAIDLEVWDQSEATGGIRAVGVTGEGSFVNRMNWGVREEYTTCNDSIRAHVGRTRDDDERMARNGIKRCKDLRGKDDDDDDDNGDGVVVIIVAGEGQSTLSSGGGLRFLTASP